MERDRGWRGWHEFCRPADAGTGRPIPTDVGNPPPPELHLPRAYTACGQRDKATALFCREIN